MRGRDGAKKGRTMGYLILLGLLALPFAVMWAFMLAIATGIFREPTETQNIAHNYRLSWQTIHV